MAKKKARKKTIILKDHLLVPKHEKISEKAKKDILEKYGISILDLPSIHKNDPAISTFKANINDVIKITRRSPTAGITIFYRVVINA